MNPIDCLVLVLYLVGTLALGLHYARRNKRSKDMFAAGRKSPWWVSGLSGFMTLKSAGTFVVWGGLAYREGVVAIAINTCIAISALLVGLFVAGQWRRTGVTTPAEFERLFPATGGALYGQAVHGSMAAFRRPGSRSSLPGLYLAGGSVHPGAGVPMAAFSGRLAASAILQDLASISSRPRAAMPGGTSTA